ncbi:28S ribosomal protein S5, mitochondrial [Gonapodya sp. JEL0774]|nr:28S ribosomal protein S5, mitochondrial [Gonapodya sp. JEL0774]
MVVVGNQSGAAGIGEGKSPDLNSAVQKALRRAIANLQPIERYENRTLWHDVENQYGASKVRLWTRAPGHGLVANRNIHTLLTASGIRDCTAKVVGSTNPMNVVKAAYEALKKQTRAEDVAKRRGRKIVDVQVG